MKKRHLPAIRFILQAVVLGLALAFVVSLLWPGLVPKRAAPAPAETRHPAAEPLPAAATLAPREGPASYATAVERAAPAVVNINTAKVVAVRRHPFFDDPVFREFFGRNFEGVITPRQKVERSLGSGVLMNEQGHILTNHHVIAGADAIQVSFRDGRTAAARIIGADPETDLAVLKTDLEKLPPITLGSSERLRVGDVVLAIGNPFGVGQTVTMGIVSATGRSHLGINVFENFIQTDAAINPGNSGGALIDAEGNLVGINSAIFSKSGGYQGIGFAIPTMLAKSVLDDILKHGRAIRGWVGISGNAVTPEIARHLNLKSTEGVVIVGVVRDGPAHRAGIEPGDLIRTIDGKAINEPRAALLAISAHKPGSKAKFDLVRDGKNISLEVPVIERPQQRAGRTE